MNVNIKFLILKFHIRMFIMQSLLQSIFSKYEAEQFQDHTTFHRQ